MSPSSQAFRSVLAGEIERFLAHKRALGRRFDNEEWALRLFDRYLDEHRVDVAGVMSAVVLERFLASRPRTRPRSFNHLLGVVRRLFEWLVVQGAIDRVPPLPSPRRQTHRRLPFLFDAETARRLIEAAGSLPDWARFPLRGPTYRTIFGLLYGLGLRVGEVTRLTFADIDQGRDIVVIRRTKFAKTRLVPHGPRLARFLGNYLDEARARRRPWHDDAPLFSFGAGRPVSRGSIGRVFRSLVEGLELETVSGGRTPRVHDLRHSFAVGTLLGWYRRGLDPGRRLLHLSTFLGHVSPDTTAIYLTVTADLLREADRRFARFAAPVIEGVTP